MDALDIPAILASVYTASTIVAVLLTLNAYFAWSIGYHERKALPFLALRHPIVAAEWFGNSRPHREPDANDIGSFVLFAVAPGINLIFVVGQLFGASKDVVRLTLHRLIDAR